MELISEILKAILSGGPVAIMAILIAIIGYLVWEKKQMEKANKEGLEKLANTFAQKVNDERKDLLAIIERYQEGHINLLEAINEIKVLIATISGKIH